MKKETQKSQKRHHKIQCSSHVLSHLENHFAFLHCNILAGFDPRNLDNKYPPILFQPRTAPIALMFFSTSDEVLNQDEPSPVTNPQFPRIINLFWAQIMFTLAALHALIRGAKAQRIGDILVQKPITVNPFLHGGFSGNVITALPHKRVKYFHFLLVISVGFHPLLPPPPLFSFLSPSLSLFRTRLR